MLRMTQNSAILNVNKCPVIWQKTASPYCCPTLRRMHLSAAYFGQAH